MRDTSASVSPSGNTQLRRLGPYDLRAKIGEGGMATVYLGRSKDGRSVALKVIKDEFSLQPEFTNMFLDEAKIVSRLSHPNIVHVEELGNEGKRLYLAMELLAGQSLWHVWSACRERGVRLRYETVAWIGARVASGLHHAHELEIEGIPQGLVHRDVNASNIIVGYDGTVKIIDFGLAKARGRISQTAAGVVKGKLAYMSPEQAIGKPLDRRTDIFALAATLWEVTTDRRLFKGVDDVDTLKRVYAAKIPDPTRFVEGYPPRLWEVLKRGLKRHADERWPDALAFSQALDELSVRAMDAGGKEAAAPSPPPASGAAIVRAVMGELFAEQRSRQEKWTAEASRQDGLVLLDTLRPPTSNASVELTLPPPSSVRGFTEALSTAGTAAPAVASPSAPSPPSPPSPSLDSLFLPAADLLTLVPRPEDDPAPDDRKQANPSDRPDSREARRARAADAKASSTTAGNRHTRDASPPRPAPAGLQVPPDAQPKVSTWLLLLIALAALALLGAILAYAL